MEELFICSISSYETPGLERELARALEKKQELLGRRPIRSVWNAILTAVDGTAGLNEEDTRRRRLMFRIWGYIFLAAGIVMLLLALFGQQTEINRKVVAVIALVLGVVMALPRDSLSSRKSRDQAAVLLQNADPEEESRVSFYGNSLSVDNGENSLELSYEKFSAFVATEHLWVLTYDDTALVLEKSKLTAGDPDRFYPDMKRNVICRSAVI